MTKEKDDSNLISSIKNKFEQSVQDLDADTASRLTQIRYRALDQKIQAIPNHILIPAGAFAALCAVLIAYNLVSQSPFSNEMILEDIDLISSTDSLELYEDLEFYEWLEDYELSS